MQSLEDRFQNAQADYLLLKNLCEAKVVRWRWASCERIEPTPYSFKRNRFSKGSWLKHPPERKGGDVYAYGFDHEGRVTVIRQPLNWSDKISQYEEFLVYSGNHVDGTLYHYWDEKAPINVTRKTFEGSRLTHSGAGLLSGTGL